MKEKTTASRPPKKKIVFVCTGNTCRSPMAEHILRGILKRRGNTSFTVTSCGLAPEVGAPMMREAQEVLTQLGLKPRAHKARRWTPAHAKRGKLVVTMTAEQKAHLPYENVFALSELSGGGDVADPFGRGFEAYAETAEQLVTMLTRFYDRVLAREEASETENF